MKHLFITGCPRSGTTMLASMLGDNTRYIATPESDFFMDFMCQHLSKKSDTVEKTEYLSFLNNNYRFKQWKLNTDKIKALPETITRTNFNAVVEKTVLAFAKAHKKPLDNSISRVDHTPNSIKNFDVLITMFPEAKFIFILRDPRAVYASVKNLDWGANTPLRLGEIWNEYLNLYLLLKKRYPNKVTLVKYEAIVSNPKQHIKALCEYADITYEDIKLEGKGFTIPGYTASQHKLVGKKVSPSQIEKWKEELTSRDVLIIETKCKQAMLAFDYQITHDRLYIIGAKEKIKMILNESYFHIKNKFKKSKREKKA